MARTLGLKGIDISEHQGAAVLADTSGLSFVVLRATIGTVVDADYAAFYAKARAAGLVVMAYCYGYPSATVSVEAQAAKFIAVAKDADFLWIDQEQSGFDDAQTQKFVDTVRASGRPIGLYHSSSGFAGVNADAQWVADYRPASVAAGYPMKGDASLGELTGWDLWQWSSTGARPGYTGAVDLDWLNPASKLASLLRVGYVTKAAYDADMAAVKYERDAIVAALTAQRNTATAELLAVQAELASLQAAYDPMEAELIAARGTLAQVAADRLSARRLMGLD